MLRRRAAQQEQTLEDVLGNASESAGATPPQEDDDSQDATDLDEIREDVYTTRLKLAEAFIEMGDKEGAHGMLEEVIADGSPDQQAVARRILDRLENGGRIAQTSRGDEGSHHFAFSVQYCGTAFSGWQRQRGQRTVQGELERALGTIANGDISVRAAGRTDAGVHASGQIAGFSTHAERPVAHWLRGVNGLTADDIHVSWIRQVSADFHPRFDAVSVVTRICFMIRVATILF